MNIHTRNLTVCNSGQYTCYGFMQLFLCSSRFDSQNRFLFSEKNFPEEFAFHWMLTLYVTSFFRWKLAAFTGTALRKLVRRDYGGKSPVGIKYQNLHSFKQGVILLCQNILETRRITHWHSTKGSMNRLIKVNLTTEKKEFTSYYLFQCKFFTSENFWINSVILYCTWPCSVK